MEFLQKLGRNIKEIRESKHLTRSQLVKLTGIDRSYLTNIELGKRNPSIKILQKIAKAFDVKISDLLKKYNS